MGHHKSSPFHTAAELLAGKDAARARVRSETDAAPSWLRAAGEESVANLVPVRGDHGWGESPGTRRGSRGKCWMV